MRVMVFVKATKNSEAGTMPSKDMKDMLTKMGQYNEELVKAGILLAADGLQPSSKGKRVRFGAARRSSWTVPYRDEGARRRLLALAGQIDGRSGRVGAPLSGSDAR